MSEPGLGDRIIAVLRIHTSNVPLSPLFCPSCHQLRPCDAQNVAEEAIRLRAEVAATREALQVANDYALEQGAYSHGANCPLESCLHRRMFEALAVLDRQTPGAASALKSASDAEVG